jgi:FtsH-binding integral membrane protein
MSKARLLAHGLVTTVVLATLISVTSVTAPVKSSGTSKALVLKLAGFRSSLWVVVRAGSQVTLWSHSPRRSWKRLDWPAATIPMQLIRESSNTAWMVTISNPGRSGSLPYAQRTYRVS